MLPAPSPDPLPHPASDQLLAWNHTTVDYPRSSTIAELFALQASRTPDRIALISNSLAGSQQLTFSELDARSNRLARHLQDLGVGPDTLVGVAMARTESLVITLLAILKAGGAYVPLDPTYPKERLTLVIGDSRMRIVVTTEESRPLLPFDLSDLTVVNAEDPAIASLSSAPVSSSAASHHLAYVIYTSGSTGRPKGVMIEHRNVVNFFTGMDIAIGSPPGVWLAVTSVSFDISVLELLWTLTRGFTVVLDEGRGPGFIAEQIARHGVTHLQMTPSLALMLTHDSRAFAALASLRTMLLGGEAVPASLIHLIQKVFKGNIYNMYGPTETTVWSTSYLIKQVGSSVSIGRPIANTQIYVLDESHEPVPVGEIGELFIGGDSVARGYWMSPELTAERFTVVPPLSSQRLYRTGDLARFLPDGNIEYLGRADYQIKLRGHRIEPGEIEAFLEQCRGVRQAVVVLREDRDGDKRLVAYLVASAGSPQSPSELRATLASKLPDYMVPSAFVFLPAFPLTDNGKIDRKALLKLPPPNLSAQAAEGASEVGTEMEQVVARAWREALGVPSVGLTDNFFDLGAHSLTVAEVQSRLQQDLGREVALVDLFEFSTVATLAAHLDGGQTAAAMNQASSRAQRRRMARNI
jgi:amino acid adenylation domain-containing protein